MKLASLRLRNFRNYGDLRLDFPSGVVVFCGANGQGKTNLIEAIHLLLRGESFRPAPPASLLRHTREGVAASARLEAEVWQESLRHDLKLNLTSGRKTALWNDKAVTSSTLARRFPVVLFSPESLAAIKEGPEARRQLVDDVVLTHAASSAKILRDFKRALRARNRLLKDAVQEKLPLAEAERVLESLDPSYLPLAAELTAARLSALKALADDFQTAARAVLRAPTVDISVDYVVSSQSAGDWSRSDILTALHKRALELRRSELSSGLSLVGPHKHDIRVLFSGKDSRFFCSQGQQRALILSFKMAQILYHYRAYQVYPFLLLDDVLSELDPDRRTNLIGFLKDIPAQIFLTTTDLSFSTDFGDRRLNVFRIEEGGADARGLSDDGK
jgi:DNA replication and repair protein RecF